MEIKSTQSLKPMETESTAQRTPAELVSNFSKILSELICKLERRTHTEQELANLDRMKKRISVLRSTLGSQELMFKSGPFLYKYTNEILNRDEKFFIDMNMRAMFGPKLKREEEFVFDLIESIKRVYKESKKIEQDEVYKAVRNLHKDYIEYCLVTGEDPERGGNN